LSKAEDELQAKREEKSNVESEAEKFKEDLKAIQAAKDVKLCRNLFFNSFFLEITRRVKF